MGWDHELAKGTRPPRAGIFSAMTARRTTALLIALTALALLVRTALVLHHHALGWHTADDAGMYLTLAAHLPHGVFSMFHPLDIPDTIKRPGYPALIHLLGSDLLTVLLVQALLSALKVPMVFLAGRAVGLHSPWALGAAALMAIEPVDALLAAQFLSETLFGTLFLGGVVVVLRARTGGPWALAALLFGAAAWVRPTGTTIALIAAAGAIPLLRATPGRALRFAAIALITVLPWALRNQRTTGHFHLGDSGAVALGYYQAPQTLQAVHPEAAAAWRRTWHDRAAATDWTDRRACRAFFCDLRKTALAVARAHPFAWARTHGEKCARILAAPGRGHVALLFPWGSTTATVLITLSAMCSLLLLAGLVIVLVRIRHAPRPLLFLLLLAAALIAMGALTTADARFKNPAMGLLVIAGAWAGQTVVERRGAQGLMAT
jgi:hypothetical protein